LRYRGCLALVESIYDIVTTRSDNVFQ
jgi:hypothetical protein